MKNVIVMSVSIILTSIAPSAFASEKGETYEGKSFYQYHQKQNFDEKRFNRLEQMGIEREAELSAIASCEAASREKCYSLGVTSRCNYRIPPKSVWSYGSTACAATAYAAAGRDLRK